MRIVYTLVWLAIYCFSLGKLAAQTLASNPFMFTDVPDPVVLRVGSNYYMTSTTMHLNPGIPIMKSNDLVNWTLVNYAYSTMDNTDALNLANGQTAYGGGSWASSITLNKGIYYVTTFSYTTGKTYIYKTSDIEKGPWTTITLNKVYHDHSLFFDDDGRVYLAYGHDDIWLTEMNADLSGEKAGGVNKLIVPKASSAAGNSFILTAEGTHLQKINGNYYVSNICWPKGSGRTQTIWKSSTVAGTYTGKVAFRSSSGSAQGGYIDTPDGKWYALFFHDDGAVGRVQDIMPVTWGTDGWPTVGVNGQVPATVDIPKGAGVISGIIESDEFSKAPPLKLQWQWNHNPQNNYWSLTQKIGFLRLTNERTDANVLRTTNTLTQRTFGPKCSGYVSMDVSGMKDGDYSGLLALQNKYGFVGVKMSGSTKNIVMVTGTNVNGTPVETASAPLNQNTVYFRIDYDFTNRTDKAYFFYSLNGTDWNAIGSTLQMSFDLEQFVGYRWGLFSYATKSSGGYADFDFFRVGATITEAINSHGSSLSVNLTSPVQNAGFAQGTPINVSATATISNGNIASVKFYDGAALLATNNIAPYSFSWTNASPGKHLLKAVATDNVGNTAIDTLSIKVNVAQGPYGGTAWPIPGTIQFENFDLGGNGFAYSDGTPGNIGGATFRTDEDVDIENCTDAGGGYNIGFATAVEWLEYTVNVASDGPYDVNLRLACNGDGRTVSLAMDGAALGNQVPVPNTAGWQNWVTITIPALPLKAGQHVLRFTVGATDYVNANYIEFKQSTLTGLEEEGNNILPAIFPNPSDQFFKVTCPSNFSYRLFDQSGRQIGYGSASEEVAIGHHLNPGLYLLQVENAGRVFVTKLQKK